MTSLHTRSTLLRFLFALALLAPGLAWAQSASEPTHRCVIGAHEGFRAVDAESVAVLVCDALAQHGYTVAELGSAPLEGAPSIQVSLHELAGQIIVRVRQSSAEGSTTRIRTLAVAKLASIPGQLEEFAARFNRDAPQVYQPQTASHAVGEVDDTSVQRDAGEEKNLSNREREPWTITAVMNLFNNGVRVGRRIRGGRVELSATLGVVLIDLNWDLCLFGPCGEPEPAEFGLLFDVGARYFLGDARLVGYLEARVNFTPEGSMFGDNSFVVPSVGAGLHWQANSGFILVAGAQLLTLLDEQEPLIPWFNLEIGWAF